MLRKPDGSPQEIPGEIFEQNCKEPLAETPTETPEPGTLDIIRIDGRWAQCRAKGYVRFLDEEGQSDQSLIMINWSEHRLLKKYTAGVDIGLFRQVYPEAITDKEIENAHYATGEDDFGHKLEIRLFGEYERK